MSEGLGGVVLNSHTSTDYVLEEAEPSASSDSWAGNCVPRLCGLTVLRDTTGTRAHLCSPPPPPTDVLWPAALSGPLG